MEISKLFKWEGVHILCDPNGNYIRDESGEPLKVYLRIAGDNDLDQIKRYALATSKKFRESGEAAALIPDLSGLSQEELLSFIVFNHVTELYKQAEREVELKYPHLPEMATLEEEEKYTEEIDSYYDRLHTATIEYANKLLEAERQALKSLPREELLSLAQRTAVDKLVEEYMLKAFNEALLYYTTFVDAEFKVPVFKDIENARNAAPFLKEQLINAYNILNLKDTELKK